jgi:hypothetical protein
MKSKITLYLLIGQIAFSFKSAFRPPGTFFVKELGYFVDQQVVEMVDWKECYFFVKNHFGEDSAKFFLPDTQVIIAHYGRNIYPSTNSKDENSPIVGVSFQQIEAYCKFRTTAVNMHPSLKNKKVVYKLLDIDTENFLKQRNLKKIRELHQEITEVIKINGEIPIYKLPKNQLIQAFGFRCIAFLEP